jgi:hypothetical protein
MRPLTLAKQNSDVEAEVNDVALLHQVLFAFEPEQTLLACGGV